MRTRNIRRRKRSSIQKKQPFFGKADGHEKPFFSSGSLQREASEKKDDKAAQKAEKKEDDKAAQKAEKKEDDKAAQKAEKKEDDKAAQKAEKKEDDKAVQKAGKEEEGAAQAKRFDSSHTPDTAPRS
ncbi:hypothetical protein [Chitinophaga solisilvae]|uniref:Uncharacterized protein n=1 Tax=Chitinophaga solisilvae TaxID=1233460 RepID=A0A433WLS6_9BACT|nr:hypothetical protein [Chitinophaga solisilvae]NSL86364.1 hypothetical protein [Chitinophaga solisilvae]